MPMPHAANKAALKAKLIQVYLAAVQKSKAGGTAEQQAQDLASDIADAVSDFVEGIMVQVDVMIPPAMIAPPGTIASAGMGASTSVTPVPMSPVSLPPTFGKVI